MTLSKINNLDYSKYINYVVIAYAFILPLSRAGISFFTALLLLLWILEGRLKYKLFLLRSNKVIGALSLFLIFNLISLLWTDAIIGSLEYTKKYWYFLPIFIIFTSIKKEYIAKTLSALIYGMFISEVISYGVFFEVWQFKHATPQNPSPFMHHIEYSVFLAFTALVLLSRIFNEENVKYKVLYIFFFITISGNLFLTAGRTGQLAFVLGVFVLALVNFKNKIKAFLLSVLFSVLIIGVAFNVSTTFHDRIIIGKNNLVNVVEKENYCSSWGSRVGAWIVSKDIIAQNPILGVGHTDNMNEFHHLIENKYPKMECIQKYFMHTHNQYLQVFTALGLIGLFLFLAIFYTLGNLEIKQVEFRNIKYMYIAVLFFSFIPEVLLHRQFSMALFACIVGLLLAQYRVENEV